MSAWQPDNVLVDGTSTSQYLPGTVAASVVAKMAKAARMGTWGPPCRVGICDWVADERDSQRPHVAGGWLPYAATFVSHNFIYAAE